MGNLLLLRDASLSDCYLPVFAWYKLGHLIVKLLLYDPNNTAFLSLHRRGGYSIGSFYEQKFQELVLPICSVQIKLLNRLDSSLFRLL